MGLGVMGLAVMARMARRLLCPAVASGQASRLPDKEAP